jgi:hypothetical protein
MEGVLMAYDFARGVAANLVASRITRKVNSAIDDSLTSDEEKLKSEQEILADIYVLLIHMYEQWSNSQQGLGDTFSFRVIYKFGQGTPYTPSHTSNREHFFIFSPVQLLLNVVSPGLGTFNQTIQPAVWTPLDLPDGSTYQLDTSMAFNQITVWQRETNTN